MRLLGEIWFAMQLGLPWWAPLAFSSLAVTMVAVFSMWRRW